MKNLYRILFLILVVQLFFSSAFGQKTKTDTTFTPYELLSSYYNSENFKPFKKRTGYLGLAFSLEDSKSLNTQGLLQNVIDGENLNYNVVVKGGLYTADYNMIGISASYFQDGFDGTVFRDPDTIQSNSLTRGFTITPNLRSSIPLTANERFSFFVELGLSFEMANTLSRETKNIDEISKTYSTQYVLGAGISPGITFFAMENFAFEIQLNVAGYQLSITDSEIDGVDQSRDVRQNINLKIDLLTLNLGLAYYFGASN